METVKAMGIKNKDVCFPPSRGEFVCAFSVVLLRAL